MLRSRRVPESMQSPFLRGRLSRAPSKSSLYSEKTRPARKLPAATKILEYSSQGTVDQLAKRRSKNSTTARRPSASQTSSRTASRSKTTSALFRELDALVSQDVSTFLDSTVKTD